MSGFFQNIDPHPLTARRVCTPRLLWGGGRKHLLGGEGVGGQYFDILEDAPTALYTTYVNTLWLFHSYTIDRTNLPFVLSSKEPLLCKCACA
jgi:hypothetical protein